MGSIASCFVLRVEFLRKTAQSFADGCLADFIGVATGGNNIPQRLVAGVANLGSSPVLPGFFKTRSGVQFLLVPLEKSPPSSKANNYRQRTLSAFSCQPSGSLVIDSHAWIMKLGASVDLRLNSFSLKSCITGKRGKHCCLDFGQMCFPILKGILGI